MRPLRRLMAQLEATSISDGGDKAAGGSSSGNGRNQSKAAAVKTPEVSASRDSVAFADGRGRRRPFLRLGR